MIFANIALGAAVFLDANTLVYHFAPDPLLGTACSDLLIRIKRQEIKGITSTHVVSEMAHRLMTLEAIKVHAWSAGGIAQRLRKNPAEVQKLTVFRQAIGEIAVFGIAVLTIPAALQDAAAAVSQATGLLTNDALIVAVMQANGLSNLASHDADFDRVPGLTRYAPRLIRASPVVGQRVGLRRRTTAKSVVLGRKPHCPAGRSGTEVGDVLGGPEV